MIPLPVFVYKPGAQQETDTLAENGGQRRAFGPRSHLHDKNDIQHNIQQRRKADEIKRMLRVTHASQNRAHRIITVNENNACHGNAGIGQGLRERFRRRMHQFHDLPAEQKAYPGDAAGETKQRRAHGGDKTAQLVMLFCADVLGDQHLSRTGKTHGDKRHAVHDIPADRNSGKPYLPQRLSYYDHVCHIVDDLKQMGQEHRHGKTDKLPVHVSGCKIRNQRMRMMMMMIHVMHKQIQYLSQFPVNLSKASVPLPDSTYYFHIRYRYGPVSHFLPQFQSLNREFLAFDCAAVTAAGGINLPLVLPLHVLAKTCIMRF